MSSYSRILVAVDMSDEAPQVLRKAKELSNAFNSEVLLVHIIEPIKLTYGEGVPVAVRDLQKKLEDESREQLAAYGKEYDIAANNQFVAVGRPETEIRKLCEDQGVDLCILGSHGRSGIKLLLGSTANGVLHGSKVDVLAIRIK